MVGDKQVSYEDCACVGGCENCEQLDYAAIVGNAKRFERERIIKLLESKITCDWKQEHCEACDQTDYLIALIKGENK